MSDRRISVPGWTAPDDDEPGSGCAPAEPAGSVTRGGGTLLIGWGLVLALISTLGVLVFGLDALPAGLLGGAGAVAALTGLVAGLADLRRRPGPLQASSSRRDGQDHDPGRGHNLEAATVRSGETLGHPSVGIALLAIGFAMVLLGVATGASPVWGIGAAVLAMGVISVLGERHG